MTAMYSVTEPIGIEIAVIAVICCHLQRNQRFNTPGSKAKTHSQWVPIHSAGTKWVSPNTIRPSLSHLQPCQHLRPNHVQPADRYITPWRLNMVEN